MRKNGWSSFIRPGTSQRKPRRGGTGEMPYRWRHTPGTKIASDWTQGRSTVGMNCRVEHTSHMTPLAVQIRLQGARLMSFTRSGPAERATDMFQRRILTIGLATAFVV